MSIVPLNDLRRGAQADGAALPDALLRVVDGGWYVHGPQHRAFEAEFAAYVGVPHCLGVASGTDALELALTALATPGRDVVVTAANAGGYTSVAARRSGLGLRFADVQPDTLCVGPEDVAALIDDRVAAVVVTHLYGRLADVGGLREVCDRADVPFVEDCAQAVGAQRDGRRAGSTGDVATFSFYPTKNLGALGDGGAVVTADDVLAGRLRALRQYGWGAKYRVDIPGGRNSRLDELQAAVLRLRLPQVDGWNARRREIIRCYVDAAAGSRLAVLPADGEHHVGHLAVAECEDRDAVREALSARGVQTDVHYPVPDHMQPALRDQHDARPLPVTEQSAQRILSLPCFPQLTEAEVEQVCGALRDL